MRSSPFFPRPLVRDSGVTRGRSGFEVRGPYTYSYIPALAPHLLGPPRAHRSTLLCVLVRVRPGTRVLRDSRTRDSRLGDHSRATAGVFSHAVKYRALEKWLRGPPRTTQSLKRGLKIFCRNDGSEPSLYLRKTPSTTGSRSLDEFTLLYAPHSLSLFFFTPSCQAKNQKASPWASTSHDLPCVDAEEQRGGHHRERPG